VYVQLGESKTPKRTSLFKTQRPEDITFEIALALLALPRQLGAHPDTGKPIIVNNGRFGPYLLHDGKFTTLPPSEDPLSIGINRAVEVMANAPKKGERAGATALRSLGKHPDDEMDVSIYKGQYGPYVKHGKINATLPKGADLDAFTLEEALPLLAARAEKAGSGKGRGKKKAAAKKAPAKKEAAEKPAKPKAKAKKAS